MKHIREFNGVGRLAQVAGVVITLVAIGCKGPDVPPFAGYYSHDGKIAVEFPRGGSGGIDPADGKWYTPVVVHYRENGQDVRVVTYMCCTVDSGSSGNYTLESKDGLVRIEDYSYCNNGDPEAIIVSISFGRQNDGSPAEIVPLERVGLD